MKTKKQLIKAVKESKARIAKERDKLRGLISDLEEIEMGCTEAVDALEEAADSLSQYL